MTSHQRAALQVHVARLVAILLIPVLFFGIFAGIQILDRTPEDISSATRQIALITAVLFALSFAFKPLRKYAVYGVWITLVAGIGSLTLGTMSSLIGGVAYLILSLGLTWTITRIYYKAMVALLREEARRRAAQAEAERMFKEFFGQYHQGQAFSPPPTATELGTAYATLGVAAAVSDDDVKSAYRRLAMKFHPDRNPGNKTAEAKMKEVTAAYNLIKKYRDGSRA
jgi:hypothetical protein